MVDDAVLEHRLYRTMRTIRTFEEAVGELFYRGRLPGFVHLYVGQEAIAAGVCASLRRDDVITSTHRGHGHLLAKGASPERMMAELFGRVDGYCRGKAGSMHIADFELGIFGANGIVGGGLPIATGAALAATFDGRERVAVAFFGDGAANEGTFGESLNLASLWRLPVVFVCEHNGFTEWTPTEELTAGSIAGRASGYDVPGHVVEADDVKAVYRAARDAVERARGGDGPSLLECRAWRLRSHNEGEEAFIGDWSYRTAEAVERERMRDPLARLEREIADREVTARIDAEVEEAIAAAVAFAEASPWPEPASALEDVFA
jgi:TPP-dependent pyruvate/acetoin dehydrogenase alpha subunit